MLELAFTIYSQEIASPISISKLSFSSSISLQLSFCFFSFGDLHNNWLFHCTIHRKFEIDWWPCCISTTLLSDSRCQRCSFLFNFFLVSLQLYSTSFDRRQDGPSQAFEFLLANRIVTFISCRQGTLSSAVSTPSVRNSSS